MSIFLITARPNWLVPVFRQTGMVLEYKRFPADYMWRPFLDLSEVAYDDTAILASIAAAEAAASAAQTAADAAQTQADTATTNAAAAQSTANTALANAATAQAAAEAAQATADEALEGNEGSYPTTCRVFSDELVYITGTRGVAIVNTFPYNIGVFTTTDLAACRYWVDLKAGTWEFNFNALKRNDCGRVAVAIDSIILDNPLDLYAAAADPLYTRNYTGVTIPTSARYQLSFTVGGKNGASSGFVFIPFKFWGRRTGE